MQTLYKTPANGSSVHMQTLDTMAENAALADDRTLAALHAMTSTGLTKGVIQSAFQGTMSGRGIVQPGSAPGTVDVAPFRALVRPTPATAEAAWRGVFSGLFVPAAGTDPMTVLAIPAGAVAPRVDLICARIEVPKASTAIATKRKEPTSGQVTTNFYSLTTSAEVTLVRVEGTAGGPPVPLPAAPADAPPVYYIPLATVAVPAAYNPAADSFAGRDIMPCGYVLDLHPQATGATVLKPASGIGLASGAYYGHVWYKPSGPGPQAFLPMTMQGGESRIIPMCFGAGAIGESATFASGDVVDNSIDWTNRFIRWQAFAAVAAAKMASAYGATSPTTPSGTTSVAGTNCAFGCGQSFANDVGGPPAKRYVAQFTPAILGSMQALSTLDLYVDPADGALKVDVGATSPACQILVFVDATAPFDT
jgi:hypothetical protein